MASLSPEPDTPDTAEEAQAGRPRFVNWLGFLLVAVAVNVLFAWGMWGAAADPSVRIWVKTLSWLPFNVIASVFYLVCFIKLGGPAWKLVALVMILFNWIAFFAA